MTIGKEGKELLVVTVGEAGRSMCGSFGEEEEGIGDLESSDSKLKF